MERFKGQGEKEAPIKELFLSLKKELEGEKPPFFEFVKRCESRIVRQRKARELATKRMWYTFRWGATLATVLLVGFLIGYVGVVQPAAENFVVKQMGRVEASSGARVTVSRYQQEKAKVIHFILESGEATFRPEKLPQHVCYVVETPHLFVRVVGTVFRVRVLSNETVIRVEEGKVWCYPKADGYILKDVLQSVTKTSVTVLEKGDQRQWGKISPSSVAIFSQKPNKDAPPSISLASSPSHPRILPAEKKTNTILFYHEEGNFAVTFLVSNILEISSLNGKEKRRISLSQWASQWFPPSLLSDSVIVVAHNGTILRFSYDGKLLFKTRPLEGKITVPPLITSQGVILSQPKGLTVYLWKGDTWNLPAEQNFLLKSRPYYDEIRDILVYANEPGSIAGYSLKKKEIVWTHRLVKEFVGAPLIGINGIAYIYGDQGNILIALAVSDGHFLWSSPLGERLTTMNICHNMLVVTLKNVSGQTIKLFSLKQGDVLATFSLAGEIISSITKKDNISFLTDQGEVYVLTPAEKKISLIAKDTSLSGLFFLSNKLAGMSPRGLIVLEK